MKMWESATMIFYILSVVVVLVTLIFNYFLFKVDVLPTGSMEPTINHRSIVFAQHTFNHPIKENKVILFYDPLKEINVIHRVRGYYYSGDKLFYLTKGDNNKYFDPPTDSSLVYGVVFIKI